jgi:hypothetical protein
MKSQKPVFFYLVSSLIFTVHTVGQQGIYVCTVVLKLVSEYEEGRWDGAIFGLAEYIDMTVQGPNIGSPGHWLLLRINMLQTASPCLTGPWTFFCLLKTGYNIPGGGDGRIWFLDRDIHINPRLAFYRLSWTALHRWELLRTNRQRRVDRLAWWGRPPPGWSWRISAAQRGAIGGLPHTFPSLPATERTAHGRRGKLSSSQIVTSFVRFFLPWGRGRWEVVGTGSFCQD